MIATTMFDLYNPGELIGPASAVTPEYFRAGEQVRVVCGAYVDQIGRVAREGTGPHRQGPLDYPWYEIALSSGVRLYVSGWGWLHPVTY